MFKRQFARYTLLGSGLCVVALSGVDALGANAHKRMKSEHHKVHHAAGTAGKISPAVEPSSDVAKPLAQQMQLHQDAKPAEAVEAVEVVEAVEPVEAAATAPSDAAIAGKAETPKPATLSRADRAVLLLGHMHAAVVHLPIAWVLLWLLFDVAGIWFGESQLLQVGPLLGAMATLSFLPAVASGLLRFDELAQASADAHTMDPALVHRNLMYWALGLCAVTYLTRKKALRAAPVLAKLYYTVLLVLCFAVVGFSAHLGGQLVYGEEFLQF